MTALHKDLTGADVHVPIAYTYADAAARAAATYVTADLYKFVRQADENSVWMITATTPAWVRIDPAGVAAVTEIVDIPIVKGTAGTITKGQAVYITGYDGVNDWVQVELAKADASATMPCLGIATGTVTDVVSGFARVQGELEDIDTSAFVLNDFVHVSPTTAGALTATHPSGPNLHQVVGIVARVHATLGVLVCKVPASYDHLSDSTPANDNTTPTSGTSAFISRRDHAHRQAAFAQARASTDQSTSSGTLADVTGVTVTVTTQLNSKLLIWADMGSVCAGNSGKFVVLVDGVQLGGGSNIHGHTGNGGGGAIMELTAALSAGSHTVKMQWARIAGTFVMNASTAPTTDGARISVLEVFA